MPVDAGPPPEIFRLAVEASPSGMIAVSGDGTIIMINGEIERLFGYAPEELLGRPVDILLPDEVRAKHATQRCGYMLRPGARRMGIGREFHGRRMAASWCCAPSSTSASASISNGCRTNSSSR